MQVRCKCVAILFHVCWKCVASLLQVCCKLTTGIWKRCASFVHVSCTFYASPIRVFFWNTRMACTRRVFEFAWCKLFASFVQVLCNRCASAVQVLCKFYVSVMQVSCTCHAMFVTFPNTRRTRVLHAAHVHSHHAWNPVRNFSCDLCLN